MTRALDDVARAVFAEWVMDVRDPRLASMVTSPLPATPLGRVGKSNDKANVAVFLASDYAFWVKGR
jgi:NAD(P)-dependent dehydrogenase (short-subunit alcohol dehydrogenase family)